MKLQTKRPPGWQQKKHKGKAEKLKFRKTGKPVSASQRVSMSAFSTADDPRHDSNPRNAE